MNKKNNNNINISILPENKIKAIKDFAKKMGYTADEFTYKSQAHWDKKNYGRPCYCIELIGTCDSEGNPYSWAWYTDTGEEII